MATSSANSATLRRKRYWAWPGDIAQRHLPADIFVVDWFYYTKMGQMDFVARSMAGSGGHESQLHKMGFQTMISVWPRFTPGSRFYDLLRKKAWFEQLADGTPTDGLPYDRAGSDIDTTNPDAARWYWDTIRDNIISHGFDAIWADETEPDLPPNGSYFQIGPGTAYYNVYPLFHTTAIYEAFAEIPQSRAHPLAGRLSGSATQWHDVLVFRYLSDLGHAQAADPDWPRLHRFGHGVLDQ